jgi:hypothetical protein
MVWHPKIVETQDNLGAHAELDKFMYHFCLQDEGQPAQLSQEEDCFKKGNFPESSSEPMGKNWHPTCFAEHALSISTFLIKPK